MGARHYKKHFNVVKSSGHYEKFSPTKLQRSLRRSGLPPHKCSNIVQTVVREIQPGASTKDIYRRAYQLVKEESKVAAVHYSLKRALFELGPSGYPFEQFVAKYFQAIGYQTRVGVTLKGRLVTHEIDVIAKNAVERIFVECKFHNHSGKKTDIKVGLYVKARWDDLSSGPEGKNLDGYCLASNTAFSKDVLTYAAGTHLRLLGVNAPVEEPFIEQVKKLNLYPITSIRRLKKHLRDELIKKDIVTCAELLNEAETLKQLGLDDHEVELLFRDVHIILGEV